MLARHSDSILYLKNIVVWKPWMSICWSGHFIKDRDMAFALSDHTSMFVSHAKGFRTTAYWFSLLISAKDQPFMDRYTVYHTWIDPFPSTHIYGHYEKKSIQNTPSFHWKSTKINQHQPKTDPMGKYTVRPDGMGDPRIPGSPPVTFFYSFCQATSRLGWRIVGLAQWLRCKDFCCQVDF